MLGAACVAPAPPPDVRPSSLRAPSAAVELAAGRCPARGEWSADGSTIVYVADCVRDPFEIRVIDAGGELSARSPDRLLAELPDGRGGWRAIDLVVVRYP